MGLTKSTTLKRWNRHVYDALKSRYLSNYFHNAIRKYGKDAFSYKVLEVCPTLEEANAAEERWIENLGTRDSGKGFNIAKGGNHTPHPIRNPWDCPICRGKMLEAAKKKWRNPEFRRKTLDTLAKVNASMTFEDRSERSKTLWTPEHREKMSSIFKEVHSRPEVREKNAAAHRGRKLSPEHVARAAESRRGKSLSSGHRESISKALKGKSFSFEHRANISRSQRGRVLSPETRAKIGAKARAAAVRRALIGSGL